MNERRARNNSVVNRRREFYERESGKQYQVPER